MHYANKRFDATRCDLLQHLEKVFPWMLQEVLGKNLETQNKLPRNLRVSPTNEINRIQFWMRCFYCRCPFWALSTSAAKWNQSSPDKIFLSLCLVFLGERFGSVCCPVTIFWPQFRWERSAERRVRRERNRVRTEGQRRVVINHVRLSDKVAVQQQVLCPLRGCESKERQRVGAGKG